LNCYENWENIDYDHTATCLTETEWLHTHYPLGTFLGPWCPPNCRWALSGRVPGGMGQNHAKEVLSIKGGG